jgi:hypothetical protein
MFDFGIEQIAASPKGNPIVYWMIRFRDGSHAIASAYRSVW